MTVENKMNYNDADNTTIYFVNWSPLALQNDRLLFRMNIWLYAFILKLIPCIVLTVITGILIRALYKADRRSARLKNGNLYRRTSAQPAPGGGGATAVADLPSVDLNPNPVAISTAARGRGSIQLGNGGQPQAQPQQPAFIVSKATASRKRSTDRTTRLLIAILVLFLLTEFPQVRVNYP